MLKPWLCLVALGLVLLPGMSAAQKKSEVAEEEQAQDQDIEDLVTAYRLVELGEKNKAPEALITAASLFRKLAKVEMGVFAEKPEITADEGADKSELVDEDAPLPDLDAQADALFAQALLMGQQLKLNLGPLVNVAKNRTIYRHPIGGPKSKSRMIGPGQNDAYHYKLKANSPTNFGFRSNVPMRVVVIRNDTNSLLFDRMGTVGSDAWFPRDKKDGKVGVTVRIRNPAKVRGNYQFWLR